MRRFQSGRNRARSRQQRRSRFEQFEARVLLACDLIMQDDGALHVLGDDMAQIVEMVDLGRGDVSVLCQDRGDDRGQPRIFSGVTAIQADLAGGDDDVKYTSRQNVNDALLRVEILLGDGNDIAEASIVLRGSADAPASSDGYWYLDFQGQSGNDRLSQDITTLTTSPTPDRPVLMGEMRGGEGLDEMAFTSRTASGGFTLVSEQINTRVGSNTSDPGCVVWDLMDGISGNVNAQIIGSDADEQITLETHEGGLGRRGVNFDLDLLGGQDEMLFNVETTALTESLLVTADFGEGNDVASIRMEQLNNKYPENMKHQVRLNGGGGVNSLSADLEYEGSPTREFHARVELHNAADKRLRVKSLPIDLLAIANAAQTASDPDCLLWDVVDSQAHDGPAMLLDIVGADLGNDIRVDVGEHQLDRMEIFVDAGDGENSVQVTQAGANTRGAVRPYDLIVAVEDPNAEIEFHGRVNQQEIATTLLPAFKVDIGDESKVLLDAKDFHDVELEVSVAAGADVAIDLRAPMDPADSATTSGKVRLVGFGTFTVASKREARVQGFDQTEITAEQIGELGVESLVHVSATGPSDSSSPLLMQVLTNNENLIDWKINVPEHQRVLANLEGVEVTGSIDVKMEGHNVHRQIERMRIHDGGSYVETIQANKPLLIIAEDVEGDALVIDSGGSFASETVGSDTNDRVVSLLNNVTINPGASFRQEIKTGRGRDVAEIWGRDIYVAAGASFDVQTELGSGQDLLVASMNATVDGSYRFAASGGRGNDVMGVVQNLRTSPPRGALDDRPSIDILLEGNGGNDLLGLLLPDRGIDDVTLHAVVDGGRGFDMACAIGDIRLINVEWELC